MPCWYYDKRELRHSPTITSGMSLDQEMEYRREGARFILQVGTKMGLRYETIATGIVYFHRFYMVHTFQQFPRHVTACCCLFLAGKVEETPKKCRDIMKTAKGLMDETSWAEFGADPREEVLTLERILLQTIKFDFIVEHPYNYLLAYAKCLKGDKKKIQNMLQMAWTFVNDSLCTTLCLQWEPEIIAIALMYLAGKLSKFEVSDWSDRTGKHTRWWDLYVEGISMELLEDICHQVLDLYSPNKAESAMGGKDIPLAGIPTGKSSRRSETSSQQLSPGQPPAKKAKKEKKEEKEREKEKEKDREKEKEKEKEEIKPVPVKTEPATPQSYQYSYPYPGFAASFPPPNNPPSSSTNPRYPSYTYTPATVQQGNPIPTVTVQPQAAPQTFQPPPSHFPGTSVPPPAVPTTQAPPAHYSSQPPPSHYAASQPPPYHPPVTTTHYPPPTNQPPPSHFHAPPPHASAASYYPPPSSSGSVGPSAYQQPPSASSYPSQTYSHSSTRQYYPPTT